MNDRQIAKWERTRSKGFWRFVCLYGVLFFGGTMLLFSLFIEPLILGRDIDSSDVVYMIVSRMIGGFMFGLCLWLIGENAYSKRPSH